MYSDVILNDHRLQVETHLDLASKSPLQNIILNPKDQNNAVNLNQILVKTCKI